MAAAGGSAWFWAAVDVLAESDVLSATIAKHIMETSVTHRLQRLGPELVGIGVAIVEALALAAIGRATFAVGAPLVDI